MLGCVTVVPGLPGLTLSAVYKQKNISIDLGCSIFGFDFFLGFEEVFVQL